MNRYMAHSLMITLMLTASTLHAQEEKGQSATLELLGTSSAGFMAIIEDLSTTRTPLSKLLPGTSCGSLADCRVLAEHMKHAGAGLAGEENRGKRIWVIEVKPQGSERERGHYDPKSSYAFNLLEIAECGATDVCPDVGPAPVGPIPDDPGCGPQDVCPDPGPGRAILNEINQGHLTARQEIPLNWRSRRYIKRLINATEQGEKDSHP
jgi:hypothetical protein